MVRRPRKSGKRANAPIALSTLLGLRPEVFDKRGVFDAVLNVDTPLFIDPSLLRECKVKELKNSYKRLKDHFRKLLVLLSTCKRPGDIFWKRAETMLTFPEAQSLCIGYAARGTSGSGSGPAIRRELLSTALEIIAAGRKEPEIFEMMGLLQPNVGPDRISDMAAGIIIEDLEAYTRRVLEEVEAEKAAPERPLVWDDGLPINPFNKKPILLAPWDILDDLPMVLDKKTYVENPGIAAAVRERFNDLIKTAWLETTPDKVGLKRGLVSNLELLDEFLRLYREGKAKPYDFKRDRHGYLAWNRVGNQIAKDFPLKLTLSKRPSADAVEAVVVKICEHFREVVENNGIWRSFYNNAMAPLHERHAQMTFFCVADAYCRTSNIDLTPEANSGRGPVDFKASVSYDSRVLAEIKLTTNNRLCHGLKVQLEEYAKAERTNRTIYLVVDVAGCPEQRYLDFRKLEKSKTTKYPRIEWVDATPQKSASKS